MTGEGAVPADKAEAKLEQADAKLPWTGSTSQPEPETPFFDRVLGVLGGG